MDTKYSQQFKRKFGYEKSIVTHLHEEIFQTTSEHEYYELGVATGVYSIYSMLDKLIKKGHDEVTLRNLMDMIKVSIDGNIKTTFDKMVDHYKEKED